MTRVRHRRRLRLARFVAWFTPLVAVGLSGAALLLEGPWLSAAAAGGALLSLLLGSMLLRLDRRWRVEIAAARWAVAADYGAEHARYVDEHRSFAAHMTGLLDAASHRIGVLSGRIASLEAEVVRLQVARLVVPEPTPALASFPDVPEWNELWPDLADAPTVVDLLKWEERTELGLVPAADDERDERTA